MIKNKNVIITGGAGFIGSNLFEKLVEWDNYVVLIDNFNDYYTGKEERIETLTSNLKLNHEFKLIKGDLLEDKIFEQIDVEIDYIFHLAAQAGVRYSLEYPSEVTTNNIISTINVLEFAIKSGVKKIINASSSSVYGNPQYTPVDEEHPKNPISPYAVSKLSGEFYVDYYHREYNISTTSLRFYTVYGPRGRPDMAIRKFIERILNNQEIIIYGDGTQIRDFTYVGDIVDGLILAAENEKSDGESFNLGCSNPIMVNELVDKIYYVLGKSKNVRHIDKKKGDVDVTYSDITKAEKLLGFSPKIDIDTGLQKTYKWHIENEVF